MRQVFNIPIPPSVNGLYFNVKGGGRRKAPGYGKWITEAGWLLRTQRPQPITGPVIVELAMKRPRANADADNRIKAALDLLVRHGIIEDDKHVRKVSAEWADIDGCTLTVIPA